MSVEQRPTAPTPPFLGARASEHTRCDLCGEPLSDRGHAALLLATHAGRVSAYLDEQVR